MTFLKRKKSIKPVPFGDGVNLGIKVASTKRDFLEKRKGKYQEELDIMAADMERLPKLMEEKKDIIAMIQAKIDKTLKEEAHNEVGDLY